MKPKHLISIRTSLFWLVTVCLLPAIVIAGGLLWRDYEQRRGETVRAAIVTARTLTVAIDREFAAVHSSLVALATSPLLATPNLAAFHAHSKEVVDRSFIENIALFDAGGRPLLHTSAPYGMVLPPAGNLEQLERVLKTGKPETSNLFIGPVGKKLVVHVAIPVKTGSIVSHVLVGNVLIGSLLPAYFHKMLADFPLPAGNILAIFDGSSAIVAVVGIAGDTDKLIGRRVNPGLAGALEKADEGSLNTINLQGVEILTAFSRSATSRWGVAIGIPHKDLMAFLWNSLWLLIGASLLILGSGITFAWILGGRIAATIRALQFPAQELGRGNPVRIPELPIREANEVGHSLVKAATTLADATAALRSSEARMRGIVVSAMDAIITVDDGQTIVLFNAAAAAMFDCPADQAIGLPITRFIPEPFHARHGASAQRSGPGVSVEAFGVTSSAVGLRRHGEEFPLEISYSNVVESGATFQTLIVRDITERVQAFRALERSNLDLQRFASVASHDMKTPLRSISGFVQLLQRNHGDKLDDKALALISRTLGATRRLEQLTDDLLSYARVNAEARPFAPTNCGEVLAEVTLLLNAAILSSGAVLTVEDLPTVLGDRTQLVQLFLNLIGNSIKYCPDRAPLMHVSAQKTDCEWVFSVVDNGIGIDARHHDKIFEVFKRLHTQNEYAGTGIGLAVCRSVVERHGGRIWVKSEVGLGSTFCFTIPDLPHNSE